MADKPNVTDKFGTEIGVGDRVEVVYGGDLHEATVEDIAYGPDQVHWLTVSVPAIEIPAGSVTVTKKAEKKAPAKKAEPAPKPDAPKDPKETKTPNQPAPKGKE